jgi:hypothetical protein
MESAATLRLNEGFGDRVREARQRLGRVRGCGRVRQPAGIFPRTVARHRRKTQTRRGEEGEEEGVEMRCKRYVCIAERVRE